MESLLPQPNGPLALIALWLLMLAWLLNNPDPRPRRRPRAEPVDEVEDQCPLCRATLDAEGSSCWCSLAEPWR